MKTTMCALWGLLVSVAVVNQASAQPAERSLEAALQELEGSRRPYDASLFMFRGCPQDDPIGREIFEAARSANVTGYDLVDLVSKLTIGTYPDCGYAPLHEWLVEVVNRLHETRDQGALQSLAWHIGDNANGTILETAPLIHVELQQAMLRVSEDDSLLGGVRERFANVALRNRPKELQIEEVIGALARPIPRRTKTLLLYQLGRTHGGAFFVPLAEAAANFSDEALATVASAIANDVSDGRVLANEPGLDELRALVKGRPSMPPWLQIPLESGQPPT